MDTQTLRNELFVRIAEILDREADEIADTWAALTVQERPHTASTHRDQLRDRVPGFLQALGESLRRSSPERGRHHMLALEHGEQRWTIGWKLTDVVADYQTLRQVILKQLEERLGQPPRLEERLAIDLYIDDAIGSAVVAFTEHQETQLRQAHQRLNEFLSVLGHELRNPLNALSMGLHLLLRAGKDTADETAAMMRGQIEAMTRLLGDMLDITRITRGQVSLDLHPIELKAVLREAEQGTRSAIAAKNQQLTLDLPADEVWVNADPNRLGQVFVNLLTNAAKYTDEGGRIDVIMEGDGDARIRVRVRDSGEGISSEVLPHIFDLFVQAPNNTGRGLGIGLALARTLVEMHAGRIDAFSQGVGQGSEFTVWLPVVNDTPGAEPEPATADPTVGDPEPTDPPAPPCRILIVDDTEPAARMLGALLQECGHTTFNAFDGEEALLVAEQERPDVILLDIGLPKLDGYEVAKRLRTSENTRGALVIAMTGYAHEPKRVQSEQTGIDHYLVKPVGLRTVQNIITRHSSPKPD